MVFNGDMGQRDEDLNTILIETTGKTLEEWAAIAERINPPARTGRPNPRCRRCGGKGIIQCFVGRSDFGRCWARGCVNKDHRTPEELALEQESSDAWGVIFEARTQARKIRMARRLAAN